MHQADTDQAAVVPTGAPLQMDVAASEFTHRRLACRAKTEIESYASRSAFDASAAGPAALGAHALLPESCVVVTKPAVLRSLDAAVTTSPASSSRAQENPVRRSSQQQASPEQHDVTPQPLAVAAATTKTCEDSERNSASLHTDEALTSDLAPVSQASSPSDMRSWHTPVHTAHQEPLPNAATTQPTASAAAASTPSEPGPSASLSVAAAAATPSPVPCLHAPGTPGRHGVQPALLAQCQLFEDASTPQLAAAAPTAQTESPPDPDPLPQPHSLVNALRVHHLLVHPSFVQNALRSGGEAAGAKLAAVPQSEVGNSRKRLKSDLLKHLQQGHVLQQGLQEIKADTSDTQHVLLGAQVRHEASASTPMFV